MEAKLALVRDLLDKRVVDRHGRELGRVDSVIVESSGAAAPLVTAIELGPSVLARRIHPLAGRWIAGLERALGIDAGRPMRVRLSQIIDVDDHVRVDVTAGETPASTLEQRLRRILSALPGGS